MKHVWLLTAMASSVVMAICMFKDKIDYATYYAVIMGFSYLNAKLEGI